MRSSFTCRFVRCCWSSPLGLMKAGVFSVLISGAAGCTPPTYDDLLGGAIDPIRVAAITRITDDGSLTDEEKREQLRGLGLTDETLIDLLVRELS